MENKKLSCIDCTVANCNHQQKSYPDFCLTTNMDPKVLEDAMKDLKDDFDFLVAGLEKLQRSGGEDYNTAVEIARSFSDRIQETIAEISERFGESNI